MARGVGDRRRACFWGITSQGDPSLGDLQGSQAHRLWQLRRGRVGVQGEGVSGFRGEGVVGFRGKGKAVRVGRCCRVREGELLGAVR